MSFHSCTVYKSSRAELREVLNELIKGNETELVGYILVRTNRFRHEKQLWDASSEAVERYMSIKDGMSGLEATSSFDIAKVEGIGTQSEKKENEGGEGAFPGFKDRKKEPASGFQNSPWIYFGVIGALMLILIVVIFNGYRK